MPKKRQLKAVFCELTTNGHGGYDLTSTSRPGIAGLHTDSKSLQSAEGTVRQAIAKQHSIDPAAIVFVRPSRTKRRDEVTP